MGGVREMRSRGMRGSGRSKLSAISYQLSAEARGRERRRSCPLQPNTDLSASEPEPTRNLQGFALLAVTSKP